MEVKGIRHRICAIRSTLPEGLLHPGDGSHHEKELMRCSASPERSEVPDKAGFYRKALIHWTVEGEIYKEKYHSPSRGNKNQPLIAIHGLKPVALTLLAVEADFCYKQQRSKE